MKFEEKFPEFKETRRGVRDRISLEMSLEELKQLQERIARLISETEEEINQGWIMNIEQHCLSKQKVREAIDKLSRICCNNFKSSIVEEALLKELGLNK